MYLTRSKALVVPAEHNKNPFWSPSRSMITTCANFSRLAAARHRCRNTTSIDLERQGWAC